MPPDESPPSLFLRIAVPLLDSHLTSLFAFAWRLGRQIFTERIAPSDYEILSYDAQLELLDVYGTEAVFSKCERVRFLQNNVIAYQDMAWGVGDIFAAYTCTPGVPVDTYREGHRYRVLISLRDSKNRGDVTEFHIERRIRNGFSEAVEDFQHEVNHVMRSMTVRLVFPKDRHPKLVTLIEQNSTRTMLLGSAHRHVLPDGRLEVQWNSTHPRLFEAYIMQWTW